MKKLNCIVAASFVLLCTTDAASKMVHIGDGNGFAAEPGSCVYTRDFSRVSEGNRSRVEHFWREVEEEHYADLQGIRDEMLKEQAQYSAFEFRGPGAEKFFEEQREQRQRVQTEAGIKEREAETAYSQRYNAFMGSLPISDRQAAAQAMAIIQSPRNPECPQGVR